MNENCLFKTRVLDPTVYSEQGIHVTDMISTHSYEHHATFIQILMKKIPISPLLCSLEPHVYNMFSGHKCKKAT